MFLAFLIGVFAGLRSLTPPAVTAISIHLGWLKVQRPLSLIGSLPAAILLTLLAFGELIADKLPIAPNRTDPIGLTARIFTGGLAGACVASGGEISPILGAALGAIGGVAGCFGGFQARTRLVKALGTRDLYVAIAEDLIAIGGSLLVVSRVQ